MSSPSNDHKLNPEDMAFLMKLSLYTKWDRDTGDDDLSLLDVTGRIAADLATFLLFADDATSVASPSLDGDATAQSSLCIDIRKK